ncbi:Aste57867_10648 [Aphanomyces stellatus]|uniref:Aste57867_10648 protein n=1 Tax=Aphanomyces stellatus TaxID=120398 RepID=A0A485KR02_9STRA|nr:hypothetical protein As57867_010608 [Aphanomyces stellatus]VFT87520.1 Aste57867_10648 [Aphanomyces stellatus]
MEATTLERKARLLEHEKLYPKRKTRDPVMKKREEDITVTAATAGGSFAGYWIDIRRQRIRPIPRDVRLIACGTGLVVGSIYFASVKTVFSLRTYYEDYHCL